MVKYTETKSIMLKLPIGTYEEILDIMKRENKWLTPQDFIKGALIKEIEKWKKERDAYGHPDRMAHDK